MSCWIFETVNCCKCHHESCYSKQSDSVGGTCHFFWMPTNTVFERLMWNVIIGVLQIDWLINNWLVDLIYILNGIIKSNVLIMVVINTSVAGEFTGDICGLLYY